MKYYMELKSQKEYMKMIVSNTINRFGDAIDCIALTWLIFELTGEASWSAILFGVNRIPTIFLMPFAGAIVEKMNKKQLMIWMDWIRGICVGLIASMLVIGSLNQWILLGLTLIISSAEAFRIPASTAFIPEILEEECYEQGLSFNSSICSAIELVGSALAGVIIAWQGAATAIYVDMITFILSGVIIWNIHSEKQVMKDEKKEINYIKQLFEGFVYLKKSKVIEYFAVCTLFLNGILVPFNCLQAPLVSQVFSAGEMMLSVISVAFMLGMIIGAVLYPTMKAKFGKKMIYRLGILSIAFYYFSFVIEVIWIHSVWGLYLCVCIVSFGVGSLVAAVNCLVNVEIMKEIDTAYLARVSALLSSASVAMIPLVSFLIGGLTKLFSVELIFTISGILDMIVCIILGSNKKLALLESGEGDCYRDEENNTKAC